MHTHKPVHANHCFECFDGGQLIICDACPASYHEGCLKNLPNSDGAWFCPDCAKGKQIFYRDIVWAKVSYIIPDVWKTPIKLSGESYEPLMGMVI